MTSMDIRKAFKEGTLMDAEGNPVTDKDEMYQMAYLADLKKNPAKYAFAKGGGVDYFDREDFYNKNPRLPRRIEISKSQYIKNKDFISKQKWARNIVDTQGYEDNNGVEFIEFDIEVNEKSSWDMWGWINENIPSSERKVFVQDERFLEYAKGGGVSNGGKVEDLSDKQLLEIYDDLYYGKKPIPMDLVNELKNRGIYPSTTERMGFSKGGMVKKSDFTMLGAGILIGGLFAYFKK